LAIYFANNKTMSEKMPQYVPSPAEERKAENMMTERERELSEVREDSLFEGAEQERKSKGATEKEISVLDKIDFNKIEENKKFLIQGEVIFDEAVNDDFHITCFWDSRHEQYVLAIRGAGSGNNKIYISKTSDLQNAVNLIVEFSRINPDFTKIYTKLSQIGNTINKEK
jgi:hypothetical protein